MEGEISIKLLNNEEFAEHGSDEDSLSSKVWQESKKIWIVAGPAIFTRVSTMGTAIISQAFIGHIGSKQLAAFALVFTVFLRFGQGLLLGMSNGMETLCGQAYGARQYHMVGIYLQRGWIVLVIASVLFLPILIFTGPILRAIGQDPEIAKIAQTMALWFIPVIFACVVSYTCQMFLQAQSKNMIIAYLAAISLLVHVFLSWLLTVHYKFGVTGAMISTVLAFWLPNIGQLMFVMCGGCPDTWTGFSMVAFHDLWPIIKHSCSAGVMLCLEIWYNTVLLLLTGNMKNAEVEIDALSICLNINGWELMISIGFMAAASVRIGNELGSGNSKAAKLSITTIVITSFSVGFIMFLCFLLSRGRISYLFTESREVASTVDRLSPLLAFSLLLNSVQPVLSGVAIGSGWQSTVAFVNIGSYYLIGVPIGVVLGYVYNWQVEGVWIGMLIGVLVQTITLVIITCRTNWDTQVSIAQKQVNRWFVQVEPDTH